MLAGGGVAFAAILFLMYWLSAHGYKFHFAVIGASLPFVFFCVGFIELVTGSPYLLLAQRWMALRGWQRGVLGTFVIGRALATELEQLVLQPRQGVVVPHRSIEMPARHPCARCVEGGTIRSGSVVPQPQLDENV